VRDVVDRRLAALDQQGQIPYLLGRGGDLDAAGDQVGVGDRGGEQGVGALQRRDAGRAYGPS
jgi:hypothetical protein